MEFVISFKKNNKNISFPCNNNFILTSIFSLSLLPVTNNINLESEWI